MDRKIALPLFFAAAGAAALAACSSYDPVTPSPEAAVVAGVVTTAPYLRAGFGRIVALTPMVGGSMRVTLAMDDNNTQYVDTPASNLHVNETVEITREGYIHYPAAPQASRSRY